MEYRQRMLDEKIQEATHILKKVANSNTMRNPLLLYSGGKDSIVMCHLAKSVLGIDKAFCESSLVPKSVDADVRLNSIKLGLNVSFTNSISPDKLAKNWFNQIPPKKWKPSNLDRIRHWKSIPRFAKGNDISMMIYGRRKEENTIPSPYYKTNKYGSILQVHPIYNWTRDEVFEYKSRYGLDFPKCYSDGSKHLYSIISLVQQEWSSSGDINKCFELMVDDFFDYLIAGSKVDDRALEFINKHREKHSGFTRFNARMPDFYKGSYIWTEEYEKKFGKW